jgi:hypothetical protein
MVRWPVDLLYFNIIMVETGELQNMLPFVYVTPFLLHNKSLIDITDRSVVLGNVRLNIPGAICIYVYIYTHTIHQV